MAFRISLTSVAASVALPSPKKRSRHRIPVASAVFALAFATSHLASAYAGIVYGGVSCAAGSACDDCNPNLATCDRDGLLFQSPYPSMCTPGEEPIAISLASPAAVVANPNIFMLHWGNYWEGAGGDLANDDVGAWKTIGTDWRFWSPLAEYSPSIAAYGPLSRIPFGWQTIPNPSAASAINSAGPSSIVTITDHEIQTELNLEIVSGTQGVPMSNRTQIYVIVLPPYVQTELSGNSYHWHFNLTTTGQSVWYAVITGLVSEQHASSPNSQFPKAQYRGMDHVIAHEVYEAVTNPEGGFGYVVQEECGGGEIADMCEDFYSDPIDGYSVGTFWANQAGGCVGPANLDISPPPPPSPDDGCGLLCNENTDTLETNCVFFKCPPPHCTPATCR